MPPPACTRLLRAHQLDQAGRNQHSSALCWVLVLLPGHHYRIASKCSPPEGFLLLHPSTCHDNNNDNLNLYHTLSAWLLRYFNHTSWVSLAIASLTRTYWFAKEKSHWLCTLLFCYVWWAYWPHRLATFFQSSLTSFTHIHTLHCNIVRACFRRHFLLGSAVKVF